MSNNISEIYLAGGCFWGVEHYFNNLKGVVETTVGYANSKTPSPSYELVCSGSTGAVETTYVKYDKNIISLEKILEHLFRIIDPYLLNRQGNDVGTQYRTGVYYIDENDFDVIKNYINHFIHKENNNKTIYVEILKLENYFLAEEYHQNYLQKNPNGYCHINLDLLQESERK